MMTSSLITSQYVSSIWRLWMVRRLRRHFEQMEFCRMQSSRASTISACVVRNSNWKASFWWILGLFRTFSLKTPSFKPCLQRTQDDRRPAPKTSDRTFFVFIRRLVGASEQLVGDKAGISALFWQRYESLLEKHNTRRIDFFGCSVEIARNFA